MTNVSVWGWRLAWLPNLMLLNPKQCMYIYHTSICTSKKISLYNWISIRPCKCVNSNPFWLSSFSQPGSHQAGGDIVCLAILNTQHASWNSPSQVTSIRFVFFRHVLSKLRVCLTLRANRRLPYLAHTVVLLYYVVTLAVEGFRRKRALLFMAACEYGYRHILQLAHCRASAPGPWR